MGGSTHSMKNDVKVQKLEAGFDWRCRLLKWEPLLARLSLNTMEHNSAFRRH